MAKKRSTPADWHGADIVAALRKAGTSLRQLSLGNNWSENTLKTAMIRPYPEGEQIIAEALGVTPQEIWPSRYNPDGTPKRKLRMYKPRKRVQQATELAGSQ